MKTNALMFFFNSKVLLYSEYILHITIQSKHKLKKFRQKVSENRVYGSIISFVGEKNTYLYFFLSCQIY